MHWSRHLVSALLAAVLLVGRPVAAQAATPSPAPLPPHDLAHPVVMQEAAQAESRASVPRLAPFTGAASLTPRKPAAAGGGSVGGPQREVFGFALASSLADPAIGYPSWDFNLLSTVAVFGLHVTTDGTFINDNGMVVWNSGQLTGLLNTAHPKGVRVVETIILQDFTAGTPSMCAGLQNRATTVSLAVQQMQAKGVDGINVDYEGLNGTCPNGQSARSMMTDLVVRLRAAMGSRAYLSVDTYASAAADPYGFFDLGGMAPSADSFFVMEYDMEYSNWQHAPLSCSRFCLGPTSPLTGYYYNETTVTAQYLNAVSPSKVIMGVPYYGRKACVAAAAANQVPTATVTADGYQDAVYDAYQQPAPVAHHLDANDPAGAEAWETWYSSAQGCTKELYWDPAGSLSAKYALVNRDGIRGVGLWNLNFGGGSQELWDALAQHFSSNVFSASSSQLYAVHDSDGSSWQEVDPTRLRLTLAPTTSETAVLAAAATLWTDTAGWNQDLGIFVSVNGGGDQLLTWKESGSVKAAYSPNASFAEVAYGLSAGSVYTVKLKLKANQPAAGVGVYSGAGTSASGFSPTTLMAHLYPAGSNPYMRTAARLYQLADSDGATWSDIDPGFRVGLVPTTSGTALISASFDLWTDSAGWNQDLGLFISTNGGSDQLLAWKESGGVAAAYSPTPAFVQSTATITSGSTYLVKLKWKANKPAPGVSIFAGAGTAQTGFSPSRLLVELSAGGNPLRVVSSQLYQLFNSDGSSWLDVDPARLRLAVSPGASVIAIIGVNADVWSATAGLNQDVGIFVSRDGGADQLVAWTESGEGGAAYSPNASYVQAAYPMVSGSSYVIKLKWKANRPVGGSTIYSGAGTSATGFSPTSLAAYLEPPASSASSVSRAQLFTLAASDGSTWKDLDGGLLLSVVPPADGSALLGGSADLWTDTAGYNQDLGLFVSTAGAADQLVAWKESGGSAPYSPNAVYVQAALPVTHGVAYTAKLKWKANRTASGVSIYAGAGTAATGFSPTRLTVQLQPPQVSAHSEQLYTLANSDGVSWTDLDASALQVAVTPAAATTARVGANADLWTANSGYGEDLGIFVSVSGGQDQLLAWAESGGNAGTYAPNAAFVEAAYHLNAGTAYRFKLKWKASQPASGATIYAGAGTES